MRFAEGKGMAANSKNREMVRPCGAADVVPATFRLGTLYEKGMSVHKDVDIARRYYLQAAERGSAKALLCSFRNTLYCVPPP